MIKLLRVDYRLIHGQITTSWVGQLGCDCILIANDKVPGDILRKNALKLAKPPETKLVMKTVEDSIEAINSGVTDKYKLFVIVENVQDARRMVEGCPVFERVNLGNIRMYAGAKQLGTTVFVSEKDMEDIRAMQEKGVSRVLELDLDEAAKQIGEEDNGIL